MQVENKPCDCYDSSNKSKERNQMSKLDERIRSIVAKEGFLTCDINKKFISSNGGNYLGVLYEIDINGKTDQDEKDIAIFVKTMATDYIDLEFISLPEVYENELFVYKSLSKVIHELQEKANIPTNDRYAMVKCYDESDTDAIFLENLTRKGFKTWYRMNIGSIEIVELCIEQLAKFHSMSFILEEKKPEFFNSKIKNVGQAFKDCKALDNFLNKFYDIAVDCLDDDMRSKLGNKLNMMLKAFTGHQFEESLIRCLCHGDYKLGNIMFKETNGKVTEVIPVDYQLINYGCPMLDFFFFVYTATDATFRRTHLMHLKNLYYNTMERFLQYFDMSVETVYPRKVFETDFKERRDYGLITIVTLGPALYIPESDVPDIAHEKLDNITIKVDGRYKDRLKGDIEEFFELGYF